MIDRVAVLELLGSALLVLFVLHLVSVVVNRARAREQAAVRNTGDAAAKPKAGASTVPVSAATVTAAAPAPETSIPKTAIPKTAIGVTRKPELKSAATVPKKSTLRGAGRPKQVGRAKAATAVKASRPRQNHANGVHRPAPVFRPLSKAKPAILRRPKRTVHVRRRKQKLPFVREASMGNTHGRGQGADHLR
jgi:hypothetical protein